MAISAVTILSLSSIQQVAPRKSKVRAALCLSGNSRTFHHSFVHEEILKNLVNPLRARMATDIFFNLKLADDARAGYGRPAANASASLEAVQKFNATVVNLIGNGTINPPRAFLSDGKSVAAPVGCANGSSVQFPFALHRGMECLRLIERHEVQMGMRYDYIYRSRPDVAFLETPVMPDRIGENEVYANGIADLSTKDFREWWLQKHEGDAKSANLSIGDHFLAGRRQSAAIALSAVQALDECEFFGVAGVKNSESMLSYWLLSHNLSIGVDTASWVVVRGGTGPECWRIDMLRVSNATLHQRMISKCSSYARECKRRGLKID